MAASLCRTGHCFINLILLSIPGAPLTMARSILTDKSVRMSIEENQIAFLTGLLAVF
jgi:hypothetical protein